ncbi:MAG: hypothetical protein SGBAC_011317 [Bacillariaceae sp.]
MSTEGKKEDCSPDTATESAKRTSDVMEVSKRHQGESDRSRRTTPRSDGESEDKSKELHGSLSSGKKERTSEQSGRSPKPRNSGRRRRSSQDNEKDSSLKSPNGRRRSSTSRRVDRTSGLSSEELSPTRRSADGEDRSTSLSPRRDTNSDDHHAKRRSRRSTKASAPGVENVTDSTTRECRKSARARASNIIDLTSPRPNEDDRDSKRRSRRSPRPSTPGVEAMSDVAETRESRKSARRSSAARRSGTSSSRSHTPPPPPPSPPPIPPLTLEDSIRELDDNLQTIRQQEEGNRNSAFMAEKKKAQERSKRRRRLFWIILCCLLLLIAAGVATIIILRTEDIQESSSITTDQPEDVAVAPTGAPTNDYLFDPPSKEDCTNLRLRRPVGDRDNTVVKSFDLHFDATLTVEKDTDVWNLEFLTSIEEYLLPSLLGCEDAVGRRSMMIRGPNRRKLSTLRYIIGDAVVTGIVDLEKPCLPENDSEFCFRSIVTLQLFLKGDVGIENLIRLIVGLIDTETFDGVSLASNNRLLQQESVADIYIPLVDRWALSGTFESVFYILIAQVTSGSAPNSTPTLPSQVPSEAPSNNPSSFGGGDGGSPVTPTRAPTTNEISNAPTASPTPRPTKRPTLVPAPGVTQLPTIAPSLQPTSVPSTAPSQNPTPTPLPTLSPVVGAIPFPTKEPTPAPTQQASASPTLAPFLGSTPSPTKVPTPGIPVPTTASPTPAPTSGPTSLPSSQPSSQPSSRPSSLPSSQPSSKPSLAPTSGPTFAPTKAPTEAVATPRPTAAESAGPSARPITILNFDDLEPLPGECLASTEITDGYKDFQWDYFGVADITCATSAGNDVWSPTNGVGPMSLSGNGFGELMSFQRYDGGTMDMISVDAFKGDPSCTFSLSGWYDGALSPAFDMDVTPDNDDWFTINLSLFVGVTKFEFFSPSCPGAMNIIFDDFKMYLN